MPATVLKRQSLQLITVAKGLNTYPGRADKNKRLAYILPAAPRVAIKCGVLRLKY